MKKLLNFIIILGITLFISSCKKTETTSWENDRDNLIGVWAGTADFVKTFEDGSQESGQRIVNLEFITKEKGSINIGSFPSSINWYYQPEPERIILQNGNGITVSGQPSLFEVILNGGNTQIWNTEFTEYDYNPTTMTSKMIEVIETWNVSKK